MGHKATDVSHADDVYPSRQAAGCVCVWDFIAADGLLSSRIRRRRRLLLLFCRISPRCQQPARARWHSEELTGCEAMLADNTNPHQRTVEYVGRHFGGIPGKLAVVVRIRIIDVERGAVAAPNKTDFWSLFESCRAIVILTLDALKMYPQGHR